MKKNILYIFTCLLFTGCNKEAKLQYKYTDQDDLFSCSSTNMELIKESVYAFEDYLKEYYSFKGPKSVETGLMNYWRTAMTKRLPAIEYINPHIIKVRDALKKEENLWITKNNFTTLNYNHPILKCISNEIKDPEVKKLFDFLIESKTFKTKVFLASMTMNDKRVKDDKGFETYLALDTFYARILNVNFNDLEENIKANKETARKEFEENSGKIIEGDLEPIK
ncbi:MAG: hypothetical protein IMY67_07940 [Bacteroidetes bacterium]|nr:hypothetical protein [Bacteroidota bacterium]